MPPKKQSGFTLVELIVATALFVLTVSLIMSLFTYTLKTNRKVQSIRSLVQGTRGFAEILSREVRNGRILYNTAGSTLPTDVDSNSSGCFASVQSNYNNGNIRNKAVVFTTSAGNLLCVYMSPNPSDSTKGRLFIKKYVTESTAGGSTSQVDQEITSSTFWLDPQTFILQVNPSTPPTSNQSSQPRVTVYADFTAQAGGSSDAASLSYQTTISTDVYDLPSRSN